MSTLTIRAPWTRRATLAVALLAAGLALPASAAEFESSQSYHLGSNETVDGNVYAAGETVRIDGVIHGDLVAAGQTVEIGPEGVVDGDVWAGGQAVVVRGLVGGDVRGAGYVVRIDDGGAVKGEMLAAGYSIELGPSSTVSGELTAAGFQGIVDGAVYGPIRFAGNGFDITGEARANIDLELADEDDAAPSNLMSNGRSADRKVAGGLHVGDRAVLGGSLTYSGASTATLPAAWQSKSRFDPNPQDRDDLTEGRDQSTAMTTALTIGGIWLGLLIFAIIIWRMAPRWSAAASDTVSGRLLPSLGVGLLAALCSVAGVVALFVALIMGLIFLGSIGLDTLIGPVFAASVIIGVLLTFGVYLLAWIGTVAVGHSIAQAVIGRVASGKANWLAWAIALLVLAALFSLPLVGAWIKLVVTLIGLGAALLAWQRQPMAVGPSTLPEVAVN